MPKKANVITKLDQRFSLANSPVQVWHNEWAEIKAELHRLEGALEGQGKAALFGMDAARRAAIIEKEHARRMLAESNPEALESERAMNAQLTQEIERLESKIEYLTEVINSLQENS